MKYKTITAFLFSLLVPVHFTFAYIPSSYDVGGKNNPIYFKEVKDPPLHTLDRSELDRLNKSNEELFKKINDFQSTAGSRIPSGYECAFNASQYVTNSAVALKNIAAEIEKAEKDPSASKYYVMSLYVFKGQVSGRFGQYLSDCKNVDSTISRYAGVPLPNVSANTQNVSAQNLFDQVCRESSGVNSYYAFETDVNKGGGRGGCGCRAGFQFDRGDYGQCVAIPVKTNDQICQSSFGSNSDWDGTKTNDGRLHCGCQTSYTWNAGQTACIAIPATLAPIPDSSAAIFTSALSTGATGNEVTQLQGFLTNLGFFQGEATGYFGSKTASAVRQYQQSKGLEAVGFVGPRTRILLNADYK